VASSAHPPPSAEQLRRCGAIWDGAQRTDCEAILTRTGVYRPEVVRDFALMRWEQLGHEIQKDLTRAMLALGALLRHAV
jgi:hypothetical protein